MDIYFLKVKYDTFLNTQVVLPEKFSCPTVSVCLLYELLRNLKLSFKIICLA